MKKYKNPEAMILNVVANDVLNSSIDAPKIDLDKNPDATPSVPLF